MLIALFLVVGGSIVLWCLGTLAFRWINCYSAERDELMIARLTTEQVARLMPTAAALRLRSLLEESQHALKQAGTSSDKHRRRYWIGQAKAISAYAIGAITRVSFR